MSCDHCKKAVTDALSAVDGVGSFTVNLEGGKATVFYDSAKVTESALNEAVEEAGYEVAA